MLLRGRGERGAFRDMRILRQMHDHALAADPRGDAVDQRGQLVIVVDMAVEIALLLHHDLGAACGETDEVEAEAGIEGIAQAHRAARRNRRSITLPRVTGLAGIDHERAHRAIGAEEARLQPPRALALLLHRGDQRHGEPRQRRGDHGLGRDRLGKTLLDDVIRQRLARADRGIALPQRLLQPRGEGGAEARGDLVARARGDIADGLQAGAAQAAGDGSLGAEREHRQRARRRRPPRHRR